MDELQNEDDKMEHLMDKRLERKNKRLCILTGVNCGLWVMACILGILSLIESGYIHYEDSEMILKTLFNNYYIYISLGLSLVIMVNEIIIFINIIKKPKITEHRKFIIVGLFLSLFMAILLLCVHVTLYVLS